MPVTEVEAPAPKPAPMAVTAHLARVADELGATAAPPFLSLKGWIVQGTKDDPRLVVNQAGSKIMVYAIDPNGVPEQLHAALNGAHPAPWNSGLAQLAPWRHVTFRVGPERQPSVSLAFLRAEEAKLEALAKRHGFQARSAEAPVTWFSQNDEWRYAMNAASYYVAPAAKPEDSAACRAATTIFDAEHPNEGLDLDP